jgi:hypothetical protein
MHAASQFGCIHYFFALGNSNNHTQTIADLGIDFHVRKYNPFRLICQMLYCQGMDVENSGKKNPLFFRKTGGFTITFLLTSLS